jgi:5-methyltetrahydrofolate--homocysteine methyltransferase
MANEDTNSPILKQALTRRILILDGATGTMVQALGLTEEDFRGKRFADHDRPLQGDNDILALTKPEAVERIHRQFLEAGADIIETDTFNATAVSQAEYGMQEYVYEMNREAAAIARRVADEFTKNTPDQPRFVAGSIGPTSQTCSISPDINQPALRRVTFHQMKDAYAEQVAGLIDGGAEILLVETIFDTLNAKAAVFAIHEQFREKKLSLPIWISGTITDASGRTLSGQTTEAFYNSLRHSDALCYGLNCALGAEALRPYLSELSRICETYVSVYPNAGLPNEMGGYDETPEHMARIVGEFAREGMVNIIGGCCGTTPDHIRALVDAVKDVEPRQLPDRPRVCRLSGLEPLTIAPDSLFVNVGERTNVSGSARFRKLIKKEKYEEALEVARQQVLNGAQMVDVNMDEGLLDSERVMVHFLNLIASDPEISRVPIMIDSSKWDIIEAGLACLQGKGVVNSISMKDGEEKFIEHAQIIRQYGAAVIVMAFDKDGQADTYDRKVEICSRAHKILTDKVGFPPEDIIFDLNIFAVGTGLKEHSRYALDYIEACREIKKRFPDCLVSGGVSNLSFAYRGNDHIREAMHSVFLYHAIKAGMDMGIVNAGQLAVYDDLDPELREVVEDIILNRDDGATAKLTEMASRFQKETAKEEETGAWRNEDVEKRLQHAIIHGILDNIDEDTEEARVKIGEPLKVIEGPLMAGMDIVGERFGSGKMFLPQVIKSARVMKKAVAILQPYMEAQKVEKRRADSRVLMATVKGDVHDIGKNIVGVVLGCNNYEVIDLGVMVPSEKIIQTAIDKDVDIVGLSGLITPSLEEMVHVASEMERTGLDLPLLIGGATTSRLHTAVKIDPAYDGTTIHVPDASKAVGVVQSLSNPEKNREVRKRVREVYDRLRDEYEQKSSRTQLISIDEARANRIPIDFSSSKPTSPKKPGVTQFDSWDLNELVPYIDWSPFFAAWELPGRYPRILEYRHVGQQARELFDDAQKMLRELIDGEIIRSAAVVGLFPANAVGDDVEIYAPDDRSRVETVFNFLRQQKQQKEGRHNGCLADFVSPKSSDIDDYLGAFVVTAGIGADEYAGKLAAEGDDYRSIMVKTLADRLAEAMAERVHELVRRELWGYAPNESLTPEQLLTESYVGIRPAPGYSACPDHLEKRKLFDLLQAEKRIGVSLTDHCAMLPLASVSGYYFAHPESRYFGVGKIDRDQVMDYATRTGRDVAEVERWLASNLAYSDRAEETQEKTPTK